MLGGPGLVFSLGVTLGTVTLGTVTLFTSWSLVALALDEALRTLVVGMLALRTVVTLGTSCDLVALAWGVGVASGTMASSEVPRGLCTFDFLETLVEDILVVLFFESLIMSGLPLQHCQGRMSPTRRRNMNGGRK